MSVLARVVLFVSSYAPLLVLFAVLRSFGPGWPTTVCLSVAVVSVIALFVMWLLIKTRMSVDNATFTDAKSRDSDVMAYVVSYVVPFAAATNTDHATRWGLALFALIIAVLYVRSAVFYVHPLLLLVGIHVYEAARNDVPVIVLTRQRYLRQSCSLRVVSLGLNVYLEKSA